ncbi:MAG: glycosyltransferase family 4 protein [Chlamydiae bacterium]|nr:glycosyltransferase family 4 protein [Chlamydiota bacterium]MBI3266524.1 glycosyltransferase family 4 protein [Chlamydiota bacterium]
MSLLTTHHSPLTTKFRIAFVVPRYETGQAGGAEIHAAQVASRLAVRGHTVEVFTTCAQDHHRWGNVFQAGEEVVGGVLVHRFPTEPKEDILFFLHLQRKMHLGLTLTSEEEAAWLKNSVHSSGLYQAIQNRSKDFDAFVFMPYLFGISYEGSRRVPDRFILIPCLHDEPYAHLNITKDLFQRALSLFFNTQPESELAHALYGLKGDSSHLVALGFDPLPEVSSDAFRKKYGIQGPYLIFVGRWEKGKNVPLLIEYFKKYFINTGTSLKLILLGSGEIEISEPFRDVIVPLGFIPLEDKWAAVKGALALCQPSLNESLSIVIMEAWSLKTPVLVHGGCAVTKYHCVQSGGGLYFSNYFEFEEALNLLMNNESLRLEMGERGDRYVRENYAWEKVIERFEKAFERYLLQRTTNNEQRTTNDERRTTK